ncbi:hypothetical protein CA223_07260 [Sphingomonas koreensis]|jgi:hypothetical protein|uniref:Uncharacterized protein n=1 Tax=Sphingomonas koreensis TaxID=93064 RepID=A0A1L6J7W6_9SPHN|nr:hypothetical protein [Sphingomonas koreensis]APR51916.1 hypothetical protein BRX40_05220 [Sphingomonas koreensis]MDC7812135.1 hypothetical protein [Sphingomonas koreensis]RSU21534.1 hypothetical protein CA224_08700 [Sphingomonas koreensis]RSU30807.1 hypothetical protein CA222_01705 [Sphingomonas koreensis]RSU31902.1 hypothetical protein CA225_00785 [Sphingomonas koreensis]
MEIDTGDAIAIAALGFSIFTFWKQHKNTAQIGWLNSLLIEKEEGDALASKRADVSASIVRHSKHTYHLRIYNRGKGNARNIRVNVLKGEGLFRDGDMAQKLPYPNLDTHQSFNLALFVHLQSPRRTTVQIEWEDDVSGGSKELTLDVF